MGCKPLMIMHHHTSGQQRQKKIRQVVDVCVMGHLSVAGGAWGHRQRICFTQDLFHSGFVSRKVPLKVPARQSSGARWCQDRCHSWRVSRCRMRAYRKDLSRGSST